MGSGLWRIFKLAFWRLLKNQISDALCLAVGTHRGLKIIKACFEPLKSVQYCFRGLVLELLMTYH